MLHIYVHIMYKASNLPVFYNVVEELNELKQLNGVMLSCGNSAYM